MKERQQCEILNEKKEELFPKKISVRGKKQMNRENFFPILWRREGKVYSEA